MSILPVTYNSGAVAVVLCLSVSVAWAQDIGAGEKSFGRCRVCHAVGTDAVNKTGPSLNGIDGRKCGSASGYRYSEANRNCAWTWNETVFVEYIRDPKAKIPGTKKLFSGVKDEAEARNLWAYLRQFGSDGKPK